MPNPGEPVDRTVKIVAFPDSKEPQGIGFHMYDESVSKTEPTDCLSFSNAGIFKSNWHHITFVLENTKGTNLKFALEPRDALWVCDAVDGERPECPKKRPKKPGSAMRLIGQVGDHHIFVRNDNKPPNGRLEFSFALNFVRASDVDSNELITYDPGGTNQNGGLEDPKFLTANSIVLGVGAVLATVALALFALR